MTYLDQFYQYDGVEVLEDAKLRFRDNKSIVDPLSLFGDKFYPLL
jgi:hypothetical protein